MFQAEKKAILIATMNAMNDRHEENETETQREEVLIIKHLQPSKQQQQPPSDVQSEPPYPQQSQPLLQQQQQQPPPQQQQQPTDPASPTVATTPEPVVIGGGEKTSPKSADTEPEYEVGSWVMLDNVQL